MARKIYNVQIPVELAPQIAKTTFQCDNEQLCFFVIWTNEAGENRRYFL